MHDYACKRRAEARRLKDLPTGRFPPSDNETILHWLEVSRFVHLDALLAIHDGDHAGVVDALHASFNLARSWGDEPDWSCHQVYVFNIEIALHALNRALVRCMWTPGELQGLQELLERELAEPRLYSATRGYRAHAIDYLEAVRDGRKQWVPMGRPAGCRALVPSGLASVSQPNHADSVRILNEIVAASRLPVEEQAAAATRIYDAHMWDDDQETFRFCAMLFPYVAWDYASCQAGLRCALLAVAAERYRQEHGAWPDSVRALIEHGYLKQVPLDPHDAQPLRYRRLADGAVFYSVGRDRIDRGGLPNRAVPPINVRVEDGFRLWDTTAAPPPAP